MYEAACYSLSFLSGFLIFDSSHPWMQWRWGITAAIDADLINIELGSNANYSTFQKIDVKHERIVIIIIQKSFNAHSLYKKKTVTTDVRQQ